jgi:hypothetical protein
MFLQLLVSELQKTPDINQKLVEVENKFEKVKEARTVADVEELFFLRHTKFDFEDTSCQISIQQLEASLIKAKHFQTASTEEEEIFV